jgi:hypothetical protein
MPTLEELGDDSAKLLATVLYAILSLRLLSSIQLVENVYFQKKIMKYRHHRRIAVVGPLALMKMRCGCADAVEERGWRDDDEIGWNF